MGGSCSSLSPTPRVKQTNQVSPSSSQKSQEQMIYDAIRRPLSPDVLPREVEREIDRAAIIEIENKLNQLKQADDTLPENEFDVLILKTLQMALKGELELESE